MGSQHLETIMNDIKEAMKARESEKLLALRTLHSEIKNFVIDNRKEADDADVGAVIARAIKQRQDSVTQFNAAGRSDLADREQSQIELFLHYQPKQLSDSELEELVAKVIASVGATDKKQMGAVMKELMPLVRGKADGKLVNAVVNRLLS